MTAHKYVTQSARASAPRPIVALRRPVHPGQAANRPVGRYGLGMAIAETPDNLRLWYDVSGSGPEAVLLIAGQAMSHRSWGRKIVPLATGRRVIRYDHRGVGASESRFPTGWSTRDFARDAIAVLDAAGVERAAVFGHSMGGRIAQWIGADYPERVSALVLSATTIGDPHGAVCSPEATAALLAGTPEALLPLFVSPAWLADHPDVEQVLTRDPTGVAAARAHFGASATHDGSSALPLIDAATLVLHGVDDQLCPVANGQILADWIRNARLHVVPRGRHMFLDEFPQVLREVIAFLDALSVPPSPDEIPTG